MLIAAKADVQQADVNGITPLLMAITNNHLDVAKFLLEKGRESERSRLVGPDASVRHCRDSESRLWPQQ